MPSGTISRPVALAAMGVSLAAGFLQPFMVSLVGRMPLSEVLFLFVTAFALVAFCMDARTINILPAPRLLFMLLVCIAVSFAGYIFADLYRMTDLRDLMRGWARLAFLVVDLIAIATLIGLSKHSLPLYQCGLAAGSVLYVLIFGPLLGEYWKFGYAVPVTLLLLLVAPLIGTWAVELALIGVGLLHLLLDYRSMGGCCLLAGSLLLVMRLPLRLRGWAVPAAAVSAAIGVLALYQYVGTKGTHRTAQSNIDRSAMAAAAWEAVVESPVIGQGSWFSRSKVFDAFFEMRYRETKISGGRGVERFGHLEGVAIHSQILVSLAEAGIFGVCFFVAYGVLLVWAIWYASAHQTGNRFAGLFLFVLICAFWDLWMSPFSGQARALISIACGIILLLWQERRGTRMFRSAPHQRPFVRTPTLANP